MDFTLLLKEKYPTLSSAQKRIANYVTKHPEKMLTQSAQDIGVQSKTSAATVIRFGKALGFNSLEALKITIARNAQELEETISINPIFSTDDTTEQLAHKVLELVTTSVQLTKRQFDYEKIAEAIQIIIDAQTIYLYGIGASGLVASDLQQKMNRTGKKAMYSTDTHTGLEFSYYMTKQDAMIAITYGGKTKEVVLALEQAKNNQAKTILITSSTDPELAKIADIVLLIPNTEELIRIGAISSKYSTMYVADLLFLGYVQGQYDEQMEENFIATSNIVNKLKV